jgi:hypothetical protein
MSSQATCHFQKFNPTLAGTMDLKKNQKPGIFKKCFKFRNSCEKTLSNNLVFEPMNFPRSPHE